MSKKIIIEFQLHVLDYIYKTFKYDEHGNPIKYSGALEQEIIETIEKSELKKDKIIRIGDRINVRVLHDSPDNSWFEFIVDDKNALG